MLIVETLTAVCTSYKDKSWQATIQCDFVGTGGQGYMKADCYMVRTSLRVKWQAFADGTVTMPSVLVRVSTTNTTGEADSEIRKSQRT